ncbi:MAG: type I-E CRISPR-associated protein Cse1/CasA [Hyphomicrobium sp.]|nr:type I-E CRISPR-associated protein Cse1/CasA [Hyphomicrobium sp.]
MPEQFSLVEQPWLHVALTSGKSAFVRLCDISRSDILRISTGRPDCDISLTEFLIGMLAVAIGPKDDDEWLERFNAPPSEDELQAAFAPFAQALILDGDSPRFFQDLQEIEGEAGPISGLLIDAPGVSTLRDNADHFVKGGQTQTLSRAGAAIVLATLQTCAPSGGAGHRTSLRGGGPLATLVVPGAPRDREPTLWERLWANVPNEMSGTPEDARRIFPWLMPTRVSDKSGDQTAPANVHPAQAFFGMPRRIRLDFMRNADKRLCDLLGIVDDVIVTRYVTRPWGTNYVGWSKGHPLSPYYKVKPADLEYLPVHLQSARVGYREWLGFAIGADGNSRLPADCVKRFQHRARFFRGKNAVVWSDARLLVAGYAMDNMKPLDFGEALMPLIVGSSDAANQLIREQAEKLIESAKLVASQLTTSVKIGLYGEGAKADSDSSVLYPVRDRFWADTEAAFFATLTDAAEQFDVPEDKLQDMHGDIRTELGGVWLQKLRTHALLVFDDTVPIGSAESKRIVDVINGRKMLMLALTGYGKAGISLFKSLALPLPETKPKKDKKDRRAA